MPATSSVSFLFALKKNLSNHTDHIKLTDILHPIDLINLTDLIDSIDFFNLQLAQDANEMRFYTML